VARARPFPQARADAVAAALDLDPECGICLACLVIVSCALDRGDPAEIARELRCLTPDLWHDGLAEPALAALRRACERGVPDAPAALADLERNGARSPVARAIVRRLAEDLLRRMRRELYVLALARERLSRASPESN